MEGVPPLQQQSTPKFRSKARKQGKKQAVGEALPLQQQSPPKFRPRATKQGNKGSVEEKLPSQHRPMEPPTPFIRYLDKLAQIPAAQLWDVLGMDKSDYGENPFLLRELEGGTCPWSTIDETPVWLPDRPANSEAIAGKYRGVQESLKRGKSAKQMRMEQYDADNEVVLWYEHMSKAGGTAFCGIAKSNMPNWQVPKYHCMPAKGTRRDGRVGSWPNKEIVEYLRKNRYAIVANEWDVFPVDKLELAGRTLAGTTRASKERNNTIRSGPQFLFLTTIRDSLDRLLSAYTFFEGRKYKNGTIAAPIATFSEWSGRVKSTKFKAAAYSRMNHVTWRFSEGKLPRSTPKSPGKKEFIWKPRFEAAIRALSQLDLILPLDLMTKDLGKAALQQLLGWKQFAVKGIFKDGDKRSGHVVTVGGVKNSNARGYFSKDEYRALWEDNWLDNILYVWCRAVFLARLHCKEIIEQF